MALRASVEGTALCSMHACTPRREDEVNTPPAGAARSLPIAVRSCEVQAATPASCRINGAWYQGEPSCFGTNIFRSSPYSWPTSHADLSASQFQ